MYPFIETIRIENGVILNLPSHNERMNRTRRELLGMDKPLDLFEFITPEKFAERTKCRVEYDAGIRKVEYAPYRIRPVQSLKLVVSDLIHYRYKSVDRTCLDELFARRDECDDILIVREGLLTDTSICNIALWNGQVWHTPSNPLLAGTARASLLASGQIVATDISVSSLEDYSRIRLFNAMIGFGEVDFCVSHCHLSSHLV